MLRTNVVKASYLLVLEDGTKLEVCAESEEAAKLKAPNGAKVLSCSPIPEENK